MSSPKILAFATMKGGTGKTNVAFNLVGFLAKQGKKVLVIDFDAQGNMTNNFKINQYVEKYDSVSDVLEKNIPFKDVILEKPIEEMPNVDLIPSDKGLTATEMRLTNAPSRHSIIKKWMEKNKNNINKYDYIICDTPPSLNISNLNALFISNSIILVTEIGLHSIQGAMGIMEQWESLCEELKVENNICGLLINKYDRRIRMTKDFMDYVDNNNILKQLVFDTIIPDNIKLRETSTANLPISYYDVRNAGYVAFAKFVDELKEIEAI